jgi:hypothetical protein
MHLLSVLVALMELVRSLKLMVSVEDPDEQQPLLLPMDGCQEGVATLKAITMWMK